MLNLEMKFLIFCLLLCSCKEVKYEEAALPDGAAGALIRCDNMTEAECMGELSKHCTHGYEVIKKDDLRVQDFNGGFVLLASCPKH